MKDPELLADAAKSKLDVEPVSAEELEKTVAGLFKLSPSLVTKLKEISQCNRMFSLRLAS